jgi:hypothetical protein
MLSLAILTHAFIRPSPSQIGSAPAQVDAAAVDARVEAEMARRLPAVIQQAVAEMAQSQERRLSKVIADSEKRLNFERKADMATIGENFEVLSKKLKLIEKDRYNVASLGGGAQ